MTNNDSKKILLIDNYDSFVFNAMHLFQMIPNVIVDVVRNDDHFLDRLEQGEYQGVIVGPGPGSPENDEYFGHCKSVIMDFGRQGLPVFGICLGFQGIFHLFGGHLKQAQSPVHGKVSQLDIREPNRLFQGVEPGVNVMRYHSLMADFTKSIPDCFHYTAYVCDNPLYGEPRLMVKSDTNGEELMALEHKDYPIYGVQFHPESFATECGALIARNFVESL